MATSGSTDFTLTRDDIIKGALRALEVLRSGSTPPASEIQDAAQALNLIIKSWMSPSNRFSDSFKAYSLEEKILTLSAKQKFSLKPTGGDMDVAIPVGISSAFRRTTDSIDSPMSPMTIEEYRSIGDKTATGTPTKWHYERHVTEGTLFLNYVPNDITDTIVLYIRREIEDVDEAGDNLDFPKEWLRPLKLQLAIDMAPEYGAEDKIASLGNTLQAAIEDVDSMDRKMVVAYFEPGRED